MDRMKGFSRRGWVAWVLVAFPLITAEVAAQTYFTRIPGLCPKVNNDVAFSDYDNDGWPDLHTSTHAQGSRHMLLHNQGDGSFADEGEALQNVFSPSSVSGGALFGDTDNDGDLDLLLPLGHVTWFQQDRLLRNVLGAFKDMTLASGLSDSLPTANAIWLDYDRDGWLDLYAGNQAIVVRPEVPAYLRNKLHRNQGDGTFSEVTREAGLDLQLSAFGGSGQGMVAADFDDDGWPDLFVHVLGGRDRLFLNDRQGGFTEAPLPDPVDDQYAYGMAAGDVDNDLDLDLFLAAGGLPSSDVPVRSRLLLNLGDAQFVDATDALGLSQFSSVQLQGPTLADIDNDGDLDLITADPATLMLNDGQGVFTDATDQSGFLHSPDDDERYFTTAVADCDLDGFLDLWGGTLWQNNGNGNHWLRVELVGTQSNRSGIGATLVATAGDLRQRRDLLGGNGLSQDEPVVHFGLGQRTQVDELEIRWPSGQVDRLREVQADQRIRVVEGLEGCHAVTPARWLQAPPESLVVGSPAELKLAVQVAPFLAGSQVTRATARMFDLGGPATQALRDRGDGTWALEAAFTVKGPNGRRTLPVTFEQQTSYGARWTRLAREIRVLPAGDLDVLEPGDAWRLTAEASVNLTKSESWESMPDWSPDGQRLIFNATGDHPYSAIYVMNADGTGRARLTEAGKYCIRPDWSPDGQRIAYIEIDAEGDWFGHVCVMDADGSNRRKIPVATCPSLDCHATEMS